MVEIWQHNQAEKTLYTKEQRLKEILKDWKSKLVEYASSDGAKEVKVKIQTMRMDAIAMEKQRMAYEAVIAGMEKKLHQSEVKQQAYISLQMELEKYKLMAHYNHWDESLTAWISPADFKKLAKGQREGKRQESISRARELQPHLY